MTAGLPSSSCCTFCSLFVVKRRNIEAWSLKALIKMRRGRAFLATWRNADSRRFRGQRIKACKHARTVGGFHPPVDRKQALSRAGFSDEAFGFWGEFLRRVSGGCTALADT